MKILMHYNDWNHLEERKKVNGYGGIGYYRIIKVAEMLKRAGFDVTVCGKELLHYGKTLEEQWDNIFKEFDVFWTVHTPDEVAGPAMIYHAQKHKKKLVMDLDDNYLDLPESNLMYERFKPQQRERAILSTILSFCDALTFSTEPLQNRIYNHIRGIHGIDKPTVVIPNMNDVADWNYPIPEKDPDKVIIGYTGSNSHQDDLKMVFPAIANLMKKHKNLHFEMMGSLSKEEVPKYLAGAGFDDDCLQRIALLPATATFAEYPPHLLSQKWDIGIAPLVDTAFTRSKSSIKWFEYSMMKIPTVASRVYPYFMELSDREMIRDGETGVLCKPKEWEDKLERLILDKNLRVKIGQAAYDFVKENWQYKDLNIRKKLVSILDLK